MTDREALKTKLRAVVYSEGEAAKNSKHGSAAATSGPTVPDDESAQAHSQAFVNVYGQNVCPQCTTCVHCCQRSVVVHLAASIRAPGLLQARAKVEIKKESVRLNDVQQLLTWVLGDAMSPTWAFIQVHGCCLQEHGELISVIRKA